MKNGVLALWRQLILALVIFALFNVAIVRLARNAPPRALVRKIATASHVDTVALGNSLMQAGFDEATFAGETKRQGAPQSALNAGLGATEPVEHLLLLRRAIQRQPHFDTLVYGIYDFQLTATKPPEMIGNRSMAYYIEPDIAASFYAHSFADRIAFRTVRFLPYLTERGQIWANVERLRRRLAETGIRKRQTENRFGRAADFTALEAASTDSFRTSCQKAIHESIPLSPAVQEILAQGQAHARRVVVVIMPMSPSHRRTFYALPEWDAYRDYVTGLLKQHGCTVIDAADWIPDAADFADNLHLNQEGAIRFTARLVHALTSMRV